MRRRDVLSYAREEFFHAQQRKFSPAGDEFFIGERTA
jgi:hypothetical protein